MVRRITTVYLESENYVRLKKLLGERFGKPMSRELDALIARRLAELGQEATTQVDVVDYGMLKRKHLQASREVDALERQLAKCKMYDPLVKLALELGLDFKELGNVDQVVPKLLENWEDAAQYAHQFITLLEMVRDKRALESQLAQLRTRTQTAQTD